MFWKSKNNFQIHVLNYLGRSTTEAQLGLESEVEPEFALESELEFAFEFEFEFELLIYFDLHHSKSRLYGS